MSGHETYTGRDYGSHAKQRAERREATGMDVALGDSVPFDLSVEFEQDLQDDLAAEARGDDRPYGITPSVLVTGNATNLRRAA